jgi:hyperosmotically inducible periplasmic protein
MPVMRRTTDASERGESGHDVRSLLASGLPLSFQEVLDMNVLFRRLASVLVVLTVFAGCQTMTGRSAGRYVDDETVTAKVKAKLVADKATNLTRVAVNTVNGTVHLQGIVDTPDQKARAQELAREVPNVRQVVNELQVSPQPSTSVK